jgi:MFS family permease
MASRQEIAAIYAGAIIQGIVLVTFPAVSAIFTSAQNYGLSNTEYGGMFVPQAITAILSSLLGAGLTRHIGGKRVLLIGLLADLLSMALLFGSQFAIGSHGLAFGLLLGATGCLGIGFGFAVPSLNTFTAAFFPQKVDSAILTLNALLGLGTALAPIFASIFVGLGFWWGLPLLMGVLTLALILFVLRLPLADSTHATSATVSEVNSRMPARFWLYAAFALLYGIGETLNGNWATVFLLQSRTPSPFLASTALTLFWTMVTVGRVIFAAIEHWLPERYVFRALPVLLALAFIGVASTPAGEPLWAVFTFGLAGLGCSALLPLVISFGQEELTTMTSAVAGNMIGFYQIGYGIAAFGVGPLQSGAGLDLAEIYRGAAVVSVALAVVAFLIASHHAHPPSDRPAGA